MRLKFDFVLIYLRRIFADCGEKIEQRKKEFCPNFDAQTDVPDSLCRIGSGNMQMR